MGLPTLKMDFTPAQIQTIRRTVAKDTNDVEFDLFISEARAYGLNPFQKQIISVVYNKDKPDKRQAIAIVTRDGKRVMAHRCGDYRPASEPAEYDADDSLKGPTNPQGIICASVRLWKQDRRGEWFPVIGEAFWEEFAPIVEKWEYSHELGKRAPTGEMELQSGNWRKMPRLMIAKCAEAQALRAGWPETFGGVHFEEEMDQRAAEVSASAALEEYEREQRLERVGGLGLLLAFDATSRLEKVQMGEVHDKVAAYLKTAEPQEAYEFATRNEVSLREFWAHDKAAALDLKKMLEAKQAAFAASVKAS